MCLSEAWSIYAYADFILSELLEYLCADFWEYIVTLEIYQCL